MAKILIAIVALFGLWLLAAPLTGSAADIVGTGVNCDDIENSKSAACASRATSDPLSGPTGILLKAVNIVSFVAGVAALIVAIYSGIKYITSNGDAQKMGNAKGTLQNALVGLIIIAISQTLLTWFIKKL